MHGAAKDIGTKIRLLDIGGGFFGRFDDEGEVGFFIFTISILKKANLTRIRLLLLLVLKYKIRYTYLLKLD